MGRGGPAQPTPVDPTAATIGARELLVRARAGQHAASDYLEDAVLAGVPTVGARRCGGGLAGTTYDSNVWAAAELAAAERPDMLLLEGSGAAIPPVAAGRTVLVTSAVRPSYELLTGMGPFRVLVSDMVVLTMCEPPLASAQQVEQVRAAVETAKTGDSRYRNRARAGSGRGRLRRAGCLLHHRPRGHPRSSAGNAPRRWRRGDHGSGLTLEPRGAAGGAGAAGGRSSRRLPGRAEGRSHRRGGSRRRIARQADRFLRQPAALDPRAMRSWTRRCWRSPIRRWRHMRDLRFWRSESGPPAAACGTTGRAAYSRPRAGAALLQGQDGSNVDAVGV